MMIPKDKIEFNQKKFMELNEKHEMFTDELLKFLGEQFFFAPASTMLSLHNAFPGGLLDHLMKITKHMINFNKTLPEALKNTEESIFKVAFLSEIGKTNLYKMCDSEWHRINQGKMYEFVPDMVAMRVSERSIYYATLNGVKLTETEMAAILNSDKPADDKQSNYHGGTLTKLLRHANEWAILEEQHAKPK